MSIGVPTADAGKKFYDVDLSAFTEMQRAFILARANGLPPAAAAADAGYAHPEINARLLLLNSAVTAALHEVTGRLLLHGAIDAAAYLTQLVTDATINPRIRVDAAKTLLDRAGYLPPRQADAAAGGKSQNEMSSEELRAFVAQAEQTLAERAEPVGSVTVAPLPPSQPVDFME